ncbi:MAG: molybdate ABC transporter substrate-binding protein [Lachnospiraceae bacterium]|jgi:molybdate transport system substrate-binding protein
MKKLIAISLVACMSFGLMTGCGSNAEPEAAPAEESSAPESSAEPVAEESKEEAPAESVEESKEEAAEEPAETTDLIVFAAASMTETLTQIAELYKEVDPSVNIQYNFDSSGTLKTQIQEGADVDIFISAGQKQMNQIDAEKDAEDGNEEGLDFVEPGTRFNILENKVVLAVPDDNPAGIESYDDLAAKLQKGSVMLAMGNEDVPVGQYTQKILAYYGLDEAALADAGSITYGTNVKEVTTQVSEGTVDAGIIYATDAYSAGLTSVAEATAEMCGQVIYPAAIMSVSKNKEAAQKFLDYLQTPEASEIFAAVGFTPLAE